VTFGSRAGFAVFAAALVGCAGHEPQPRIDAVEPALAYTDGDIRLVLTGAGFLPSFRLDPVTGERVATMEDFSGRVGCESTRLPLSNFGWVGPTQISASLDIQDADDLAVGPCDVEITDPRGNKAVLTAGFRAMGRHTFAPALTIVSPAGGDPYAPGCTIHGHVTAADQPPGTMTGLTWTYAEFGNADESESRRVTGTCPFEPGSVSVDCTFDVSISSDLLPGTEVTLTIAASDDAAPPNQTSVKYPIRLTPIPTVDLVRPATGGVAGGTNVVIKGSGFVAGSRVSFGDSLLIPNGGIVVDPQTITGYAPAHPAPGSVPVIVQSRLGVASSASGFEYLPRPQILSISPNYAKQGTDTDVQVLGTNFTADTIIYLGRTLADAKSLKNPSWLSISGIIRGTVPAASAPGRTTVWAFDANNGWTSLPNGFSWIQ
jgi:hypothetical protein